MNIKWYGHSAFKMTTAGGTRLIIDPYEQGCFNGALSYDKITDEADIVLVSHNHADHNCINNIKGNYDYVCMEGRYEVADVKIATIPTFHDNAKGRERGRNLIARIEADGLIVVHLGDLGHDLDLNDLEKIGVVDILLLPIGGKHTIEAEMATEVMNDINPKITIPMHYKTEKCCLPLTPVDAFLKDKGNVRVYEGTKLEIDQESLPKQGGIFVLQFAM